MQEARRVQSAYKRVVVILRKRSVRKMQKRSVWPGGATTAAPYSPGIVTGNLVFVSGQVPMDPETKNIVQGQFEDHVRQCIRNVETILKAAGTDLSHAVKVVVFLKDMDNFSRLNAVYKEYW